MRALSQIAISVLANVNYELSKPMTDDNIEAWAKRDEMTGEQLSNQDLLNIPGRLKQAADSQKGGCFCFGEWYPDGTIPHAYIFLCVPYPNFLPTLKQSFGAPADYPVYTDPSSAPYIVARDFRTPGFGLWHERGHDEAKFDERKADC